MVNSASAALAEFKSQRMGGLLSGTSSTVGAPPIAGTSLADSASARMARSAPKKSSTMFMDQVRQSGRALHETKMAGFQAQQQARNPASAGGQTGYRIPSGGKPQTGGARGAYGVTLAAGDSFKRLSGAFNRAGLGNISVNSGGRTYEEQAHLYDLYRSGRGNLAAPPGSSLHESGIAMDWGGIGGVGSRGHNWLRENAAQFGWYWTGGSFSQIESWHWEYHPEWGGR